MEQYGKLRQQLVYHLSGHGAHIDFDAAVEGFPVALAGKQVPDLAHTAWQLVFHLHTAQWDILEFCRDPGHVSPEYPSGYWPKSASLESEEQWRREIDSFRKDLRAMTELVKDPGNDLSRITAGPRERILFQKICLFSHCLKGEDRISKAKKMILPAPTLWRMITGIPAS